MIRLFLVAEPHDSQGILKDEGLKQMNRQTHKVAEPHDSQGILKVVKRLAADRESRCRGTPRFAGNTERLQYVSLRYIRTMVSRNPTIRREY